jgi:integrase
MSKRLTDRYIQSLRPPEVGRLVVADAAVEGLSLRITPKGSRSWLLRYRPRGQKQQAIVLGPYPTVSLAEARERGAAVVAAAKKGQDLIELERQRAEEQRRAKERARTLRQVAQDYVAHCKANLKSARQIDSWMRNHILPAIGDRVIGELRRADIVELLDRLEHQARLRQTVNRVRETLLALFEFALERQFVDANPVAGTRRRKVEIKRRRVLSRDEIKALWEGLDHVSDPGRSFVRFLLLTGCRREEARAMHWDELDLGVPVWTVPAGRTKNGRPHEVPLTAPAVALLTQLRRQGPFVFSLDGRRPMAGMSGLKDRIDRKSGLNGWRFHDLRRTLRSGIAELGVIYEVAERVIGHAMPSLDQTYNVHSYFLEKKDALERWANHVLGLVEGRTATVLSIRRNG